MILNYEKIKKRKKPQASSFKPNDADLEHIAEAIKQGYDQGELIQEEDEE